MTVNFDKNQAVLDKDFQLFYSTGEKDVGLTVLTHRPISTEDGYFTMLLTPKVELAKEYEVPRDMVLVLDTSGSMRGVKMEQARKAMKYCLENLGPKDRFALIHFATTVNKYRDALLDATPEQVTEAKKWVEKLEATGGTAINDALAAALDYPHRRHGPVVHHRLLHRRPADHRRNQHRQDSSEHRRQEHGQHAHLHLRRRRRRQRDVPRPARRAQPRRGHLRAAGRGHRGQGQRPVQQDQQSGADEPEATPTNDVSFNEIYPPQLPDLFHGSQLIVLGRYSGKGPSAIKLTGMVGKEKKEFVYEVTFPDKTNDDHAFVEQLWARRKVGYMLDQIRANGEKKELVDEVVALAKKYGITTPYTSYLIVPDAAMPVAGNKAADGKPNVRFQSESKATSAPALSAGRSFR